MQKQSGPYKKIYIRNAKDNILNKIFCYTTRQFINYPNRNIRMNVSDFKSSLKEMPKVRNSVTETFQNSCSIHLEVGKQCPKSVIATILCFTFSLKVFCNKTRRPFSLLSFTRNFARGAKFFFVFLTLVLHKSAQIMKNSVPRTKFRPVENSPCVWKKYK